MRVNIESLEFDTIIGILDEERKTPQKVKIDLSAEYEYDGKEFLNYADIAKYIKKDITDSKYLLIEDALISLKKHLKETYPYIKSLYISISKPQILSDCTVSVSEKWNF